MEADAEAGGPNDAAALARLANEKAKTKGAVETLKVLRNLLNTSASTEKKLDDALRETITGHKCAPLPSLQLQRRMTIPFCVPLQG